MQMLPRLITPEAIGISLRLVRQGLIGPHGADAGRGSKAFRRRK